MQSFEEKNAENPALSTQPPMQPPASREAADDINSKLSPPTPDNPPWNIWIALGTWAASVIFIIVFPNFFLIPYLAQQNINFTDQAAIMDFVKTDPTSVLLQILSVFPAHLFTLVLAWIVITNFRKYPFRQMLGWNLNGFKIWHSFAIVIGFLGLAVLFSKVFGEPKNDFQEMLKTSRAIVFPIAILATFTAPLVEEVVYRGILYSSLQRRLGIIWAVVTVTFLFGLVHVPQYSNQFVPDYPTVSLLFLLSLTLTLIRVYTKNLLPCIILHTIFNGIQSLLLILEPYLREIQEAPEQSTAAFLHFFK